MNNFFKSENPIPSHRPNTETENHFSKGAEFKFQTKFLLHNASTLSMVFSVPFSDSLSLTLPWFDSFILYIKQN